LCEGLTALQFRNVCRWEFQCRWQGDIDPVWVDTHVELAVQGCLRLGVLPVVFIVGYL